MKGEDEKMEVAVCTAKVKIVARFPDFQCIVAYDGNLYRASIDAENKTISFDVVKDEVPMK